MYRHKESEIYLKPLTGSMSFSHSHHVHFVVLCASSNASPSPNRIRIRQPVFYLLRLYPLPSMQLCFFSTCTHPTKDFNNAGGRAALDFSVLFQIFVLFIFGAQQVERLSIITNAWFPTVLVLIISFVVSTNACSVNVLN